MYVSVHVSMSEYVCEGGSVSPTVCLCVPLCACMFQWVWVSIYVLVCK